MILERIATPADVKRLARPELDGLAREIRETLIRVCADNGGHLAPNLGVVELTLALARVLDLPPDTVVWDVSHQSYVYKLITGRADRFHTLRRGQGISGFSMRSESEFDAFGAGHASTAISAALGMATARDLHGRDETIVAVIGDGALTGGLAYEAINNAGQMKTNFLVVLNDNEMSIAPNVGSIASYLGVLRSKPLFTRGRAFTKELLDHVPLGDTARRAFSTAELAALRFVGQDNKAAVIFEELGFRYIGPVDGHDIDTLVDVISNARAIPGPVLLHVRTVKGKGYQLAEGDSRTFHGVGPGVYHPDEGKLEKHATRPTHAQAFADALIAAAERDSRIVAITAAMPDGTGLAKFAKRFPERYFDVGIAEAHAVCFAAGTSTKGVKPVCAIYSTFLQRAYDQVIHDVAIQNLPVVFAIDRAGFVGDDGPTHMGLYDIAYLRTVPNITLMAPRDEHEIAPMLDLALALDAPAALRYPRGSTSGRHDEPIAPVVLGKAETLRGGSEVAILALGSTVDVALDAYDLLREEGGPLPTVVNARFVVPLDESLLLSLAETHHRIITLEEHSLAGGFGSAVVEFVNDRGLALRVERIGVPNVLVQHNSPAAQRAQIGLTAENVAARVRTLHPSPAV